MPPLPQESGAIVSPLRPVDQCAVCGRFVGRYPVGFCCDTHCASCTCHRCAVPDPPARWYGGAGWS